MFQVFKKMFEEVARQSLFHKYTINEDGRGVWNEDISNKDFLLDKGIDLDDFDTRRMIILTRHDNYVGTFYKTRDGKYICVEIGADYADDDRYFRFLAKRLLNEYNRDHNDDREVGDWDIDTDNSADKFNKQSNDYNTDNDYDYDYDNMEKLLNKYRKNRNDENNEDENNENMETEDTDEVDNNDNTDNNNDSNEEQQPLDEDKEHLFNKLLGQDNDEIDFDAQNPSQPDNKDGMNRQGMPNSQIAPNKKEGKKDAKKEEQDNLNSLKESLTTQITELIKSYEKMFGAFEIKSDNNDKNNDKKTK